jgi:mRNA interferase MazF
VDYFQSPGWSRTGRQTARPGVVSGSYDRKVGLAVLCPITNQIKGYPFEVVIPHGLKVTGAILADQVKNLDWKARDTKLICKLPSSVTDDALRKLNILLRVT